MNDERVLKKPKDVSALAERLSSSSEVTRFDRGREKEAWTLAHAFADLEESFVKFARHHLPRLTRDDLSPSEIRKVLLDIGEEFRHILYHLNDPKFYRYLQNRPRKK